MFRPASLVLERLRFAQKFVVVALVLAVPLGVVAFAYSKEQRSGVAATAQERVGLAAMEPLLRLDEAVAAARHAAVTSGDAVPVGRATVAAVDSTQRKWGARLGTDGAWRELRQQIVVAGLTSGRATALAAYDGVDIGLENLIVSVGDGSRLSVDPDLDASYLLDAIERRIPTLLDTTSRIVDQVSVDAHEGFPDRIQLLSQVDVAVGSIDGTAAALDRDVATASSRTSDRGVRALMPARLAKADDAVSLLDQDLRNVRSIRRSLAAIPAAARPIAAASRQLTQAATSALDRLLQARIAADTSRANLVELLAAGAAIAALYLFGGFYYCVAGAVRKIVISLRSVAEGQLSGQLVVTNRDELGYVATAINEMVDKVRGATERLAHDATHDSLTGLPNRPSVIAELERSLPRVSQRQTLSVLFVDLDGFKLINDSLGHSVGDEVLRETSTRLQATVRPIDSVARLSGDEFVIVSRGLRDVREAVAMAERILAAITPQMTVRPVEGEPRCVSVGASIGVTFVTDPTTSADQIVRDADVAMYRGKELGRRRVEVFDEGMRATAEQRQKLSEELRQAIAEQEVRVYYQPIVDVETGDLRGFEALASWAHPERGILGPDAFMPAAERSGLIVPLGTQVLRQACLQLAAWQADPAMPTGLHMAVNLSARQLADDGIVDVVIEAIDDAAIDPRSLWLEITESALLADARTATEVLVKLHEIGVLLAVDDFGTGYSSLQHLKIFPLDVIKIDRSFVSGLGTDDGDEAIVRAVIGLATALGFTVVAEGVESSRQRKWLLDLGCELAQGYLFARPAPASEIRVPTVPATEAG